MCYMYIPPTIEQVVELFFSNQYNRVINQWEITERQFLLLGVIKNNMNATQYPVKKALKCKKDNIHNNLAT